ncbi:hypothetical protein PLESTB_001715300 [Pleodorina starrii]|uniref:Uncharacterized protein n=1 Tax=Pleodorina starrii TaxID=330485 RepID=A0A9W6BZD5_9CHLO|nr:hypothetical protein PLESTB_001715300 [Pleodorina starrii]GLC75889.1 hypothetical protein PLESTF_001700800 [Pleodorina starrii]
MAAAQTARQQPYQQQQPQQPYQQQPPQQQHQPRVLYRRPTAVAVPKAPEGWAAEETSASSPLAPTPPVHRVASAPSPTTRPHRAASQHVVWAKDAHSPSAAASAAGGRLLPPRPASAGSPRAAGGGSSGSGSGDGGDAAASGGGGGFRVYGGSPSLNAAAAALAERQTVAEALASLRPQCRCCRDGGNPPSSIGGSRKDVEGLSEELRRLRGELSACQDQNRLLRTERQRMEEELNRCRTSLIKAEEVLNTRERSLSPNTGMSSMFRSPSTTALVTKLREQLAAQTTQTESLRAQLDEVMRATRATRVAELQAEMKAQERELGRQAEMARLMRRRLEEAEARAAEAIDRCNTAERLARMQGPLAALQQAMTASEAKLSGEGATLAAAAPPAPPAPPPAAATAGRGETSGQASPRGVAAAKVKQQQQQHGAAVPPEQGGGGGGGGAAADWLEVPASPARQSPPAAAAAAAAASPSSQASSAATPPPSSSPSFCALSGGQALASGRVKRTMAALGEAHRALLSQATLLSEVFPPGLTTEQLCVRAALRPATSGAPEVLRYLRYHMHKLVDVLSGLPGNRLEMIQDEEPNGNGNNRNGNNRNGANRQQRGATPRTSMSGQGLRGSGGGGRGRSGGGGTAGGTAGGGAAEEFDPWTLLSELLDFVRWLRSLDGKSLETRPDLEGGLEQLSSVVGICDQETRRLLGKAAG